MDEDAETGMVEPDPSVSEGEHGAEDAEEAIVVEALEGEELEPAALALPVHSTRSLVQGPRGCWAISRRAGGEPCGAAAMKGHDYCAAHSGIGVASDPAGYAPAGNEASRRTRAAQARLRLELGLTRPNSPRGHLRARAYAERERLAATVVTGALDDPRLALRLIDSVDPPEKATVSVSLPQSPEDVQGLSLSQLLALAEAHGITPTPQLPS